MAKPMAVAWATEPALATMAGVSTSLRKLTALGLLINFNIRYPDIVVCY